MSVSYLLWRDIFKKCCHAKAFKIQNDPTRSASFINLFGLGRVVHSGPRWETRTPDILLPNQARYQLRYTRIFNFCHYITVGKKIKDFSVCGHSCGQSRFCAAFGNREKSCKRRCRKALRRFDLPRPGYRHGTPKASALSTTLIPDMKFRPYYRLHSDRLKLPDEIYIPDAPNPCAFKGDRGGGEAKPGDQTIRKWPTHRTKRSQNTQFLAKTQNVAERLFSILLKSSAKSSPI